MEQLQYMKQGGVYQIYCKAIQEDGVGDLYKKYEELKAKLEKEGLFDESHKKKIPILPKTIGVITSRNWCSNKRHNKCINKKKSKCVYKIITSSCSR